MKKTTIALAAASFAALSASAWAQTAQVASAPKTLPEIVVTGNPLANPELLPAASTLSGDALTIKREGTLGATLRQQPGVSSSYFGPNADRPIIRGLDADRIRILSNSGASIDASSLSNDHAVPIDPLAVERIEVLRGAAALLYGGNAVGGVVNLIDNRIPRSSVEGFGGTLDARLGSANREQNLAGLLEFGSAAGFNLHADFFTRNARDSRIPGLQYTPNRRADALAAGESGGGTGVISNSSGKADGGALGGSYTFANGFAGAALSTYRSEYGVVAEEAVRIRMQQENLRAEGELRKVNSLIDTVRFKASSTDYGHTEFEDGLPATVFKSRGNELRLEAQHAALAGWKGIVGAQFENQRFSALGAEAFVPSTQTRTSALFVYEETKIAGVTLSLGGRHERSRVSSAGEDASNPDDDRFGAVKSRKFGLTSLSAGALYPLSASWTASLQLSRTERAPTFYELYADGVHAATGTYELGNPLHNKERSQSIELGLRYKQGNISSKLNVYNTRFANYIGLFDSGLRFQVDEDGDGAFDVDVPIFNFSATAARFSGFEWEGKMRVADGGYRLDISAKIDAVKATDRLTRQALPRIAPLRAGLGLEWRRGNWQAGGDIEYNAKARVPAGEYQSGAYTLVNLNASYKLTNAKTSTLFYAKLNNLSNISARPATSLLREIAPLPGRQLQLGMQLKF